MAAASAMVALSTVLPCHCGRRGGGRGTTTPPDTAAPAKEPSFASALRTVTPPAVVAATLMSLPPPPPPAPAPAPLPAAGLSAARPAVPAPLAITTVAAATCARLSDVADDLADGASSSNENVCRFVACDDGVPGPDTGKSDSGVAVVACVRDDFAVPVLDGSAVAGSVCEPFSATWTVMQPRDSCG